MILLNYGPVFADIKASRVIGVAPLGVNFSAGADFSTDGNRPFHELFYSWDFGNPTSDIWAVSEKSKNKASGPITAHIFEIPGTYVVSLAVADSNGRVSTEQIEITVQDPDEIYSGDNTICFSDTTNNDFQGCPSGAVQIATDDISTIKSAIASGKRILLGRG
ncbi:MAG: PKD domain-containing protein, partial [Desulfobacterales bacterium]|nr:PKD domain-containing protein [Desulfobacterales bacterium]